jgi:membrane associated rhomboid family serine protease
MQLPISMTLILIAITVAFSLIGFYSSTFSEGCLHWPYRIKRNGQYYRWVTSGFLHAHFAHLFFNMFTLFFFGLHLEYLLQGYGLGDHTTFLFLYISAITLSDLPTYFKYADTYRYRSLGASGAVSAIVFATIVFDPWNSIYLYGAFRLSAMAYAVLFVTYSIYMGKRGNDGVNHDAHLWGAIYGIGFTMVLIGLKRPELFERIIGELKHPSLFGHG